MKEKGLIKFQGYNLCLKAKSVDFLGNEWEEETINQQIHNLKINNVYKDYFEGNMPIPNAEWLELTYITYENSKLFDSSLK